MTHSLRGRLCLGVMAGTLLLAISACSGRVDKQGNEPDPEALAAIEAGVHTQADVAERLGTPSSVATFDRNIWYYISRETRTFAFFEPSVIEQQVVVVKFDNAGYVQEMNQFDLDDGESVQITSRESPTTGKELGLIEQLYTTLLRGRGSTGTNQGFER